MDKDDSAPFADINGHAVQFLRRKWTRKAPLKAVKDPLVSLDGAREMGVDELADKALRMVDGLYETRDRKCCIPMCREIVSAKTHRDNARRGFKSYCNAHRGGQYAPLPLWPCKICGDPSTRSSNRSLRVGKNTNAYCDAHKGVKTRSPLEPCAVCGQDATKDSSQRLRLGQTRKAYCASHPRGITIATPK